MTRVLTMLLWSFHCSVCSEIHGRGLSTFYKMQIACDQLRASPCSHAIGLDLRCDLVGLNVTKSKDRPPARKPGSRSYMAGKVKFNIKRHTTRRSWDAALRVCQSEGGSLVKIDTEEKEAEIIKDLGNLSSQVFLWIGLRYFKVKRGFLWTDKTPLGHENWGSGEPSHTCKDVDGTTTLVEDCVALAVPWLLRVNWNDRPCYFTSGFICEVH